MKIKDTKKLIKKKLIYQLRLGEYGSRCCKAMKRKKKLNGQMLFICKNTFDIFKNGNMDIAPTLAKKLIMLIR